MLTRSSYPFSISRLRDQMDELFSDFFGPERALTGGFHAWPGARSFPALNIWENADRIHVEAEVPGLGMDDLELEVTGKVLTIRGERKPDYPENATEHRHERVFGAFQRAVTLPVEIDTDQVHAELQNGVLSIHLQKAEAARPRKIEVAGAAL